MKVEHDIIERGIEVLDKIESAPTTSRDGYQDVPVDVIVIESARIIS